MKNMIKYLCIFLFLAVGIYSCGKSQKKSPQEIQARQDSIQQARQDSLQRVRQQRQDSLAKARADSVAKAKKQAKEQQAAQISLQKNGHYAIQVTSWRSRTKAQQEAQAWEKRGFSNAYVVETGNKDTGDVWFRVRLGKTDSLQKARKLSQQIANKYQVKTWVANAS